LLNQFSSRGKTERIRSFTFRLPTKRVLLSNQKDSLPLVFANKNQFFCFINSTNLRAIMSDNKNEFEIPRDDEDEDDVRERGEGKGSEGDDEAGEDERGQAGVEDDGEEKAKSDDDGDDDDDDDEDDEDDDDDDESGDDEPSDAEDLEAGDDDDDDLDEEDDDNKKKTKKKKKRKNKFIDDVADEDDDDDRRGKKKKKSKGKDGKAVSRFIDDIADAAGSDDEEEEDIDEDEPIDDAEREALAKEMDTRLHARIEQAARIDAADDEELERMVKERYESRRYADAYDEEGRRQGPVLNEYVDQQSLHPTVSDPKLWIVPVKQGKEREVTVCLMQKMINLQNTNKPPMKIMSVLTQDHLKGYIYVEAMRDDHVKKALQGLRHVYHMKPPRLVPLKEMVESITVAKKEVDVVRPDSWVRMRSGVYKADLAKVVEVNYGDNSCVVKVLPRFDYQHLADKESGEAKNKPKPSVRPGARLFSENEAKSKNLSFERGKFDRQLNDRVDVLCGAHKIKDGYLLKRCALTTVKLTEAPSLDEIQKFAPGGEEDDEDDDEDEDGTKKKSSNNHIKRLAKLTVNDKNKKSASKFLVGDQVIVVEGDLRNLEGVIKRIDPDGRVIIDPTHKDLTDPLPFNPEQLRKHFKVGATVRVVNGAHEGASGMVVKVSDQIATIFSTSTNEEFAVFMRDLADDAEAATRVDRIGEYALHDLAMLEDGNVGVLTRVEKDVAFVLTNAGTLERPNIIACKLADLKRKMNSRNQTAQDGAMEVIEAGSIVRINEGQLKDVNATVEHIFKGTVWVKARGVQRDGGIVCLRSRQCFVHGGAGTRQGAIIPGLTPALQSHFTNAPKSPGHALIAQSMGLSAQIANATGSSYTQPAQRRPVIQERFGRERADPMVGKLVTIRKGVYAGYKGKVIDCGPKTARIELQAQARTVTVNREDLGGSAPASAYGMASEGGSYGGAYGQAAPDRYAAQTPAHTAMTPAHAGYATTPARDNAWNPTMTPGRDEAWGADEPSTAAQTGSIAAEYGKKGSAKKELVPDGYDGDYLPGVVVKLMNGTQGVIKRVHGVGGSALDIAPGVSTMKSGVEHFDKISRGARVETVAEENVELVVPLKGDDVIVVNGDERGDIAELIMVDGADGVLKVKSSDAEKNGEVIIVDMSRLARYYLDK
jgi:transcription elongation factor SPT5